MILCSFAALAFWDLRRSRPQLTVREFGKELWAALRLVAPISPVLLVLFSFVCMILISVPKKLGFDERYCMAIIFYGQFYGPFTVVYWTMKKGWVEQAKNSSVLPTTERLGGGGQQGRAMSRLVR